MPAGMHRQPARRVHGTGGQVWQCVRGGACGCTVCDYALSFELPQLP
jgi:hypothetical protein